MTAHRRSVASVIVFLVLGASFMQDSLAQNQSGGLLNQAEQLRQQEQAALEAQRQQEERDLQARQERAESVARAKAALYEAKALGDDIAATLAAIEREQRAWDATVIPLLTNEQGKAIAGSDNLARQFRAHYERTARPTANQVQALQAQTQTLLAPVKQAMQELEPTYTPSLELVQSLKRIHQQAALMLVNCAAPREDIQGLLALAQHQDATSTVTLEAVLRRIKAQEAQSAADTINAAAAQAEDRTTKEMAAAQQRKVLAEGEARVAQVELARQAVEQEARNSAEATRVALAAEAAANHKANLKTRALSADVQQRLAPFIGLHNSKLFNINRRDGSAIIHGARDRCPLSLQKIREFGALEPSKEGLRRLIAIAGAPKNGRPDWPNPEAIAPLAQQDLIEFGAILVEIELEDRGQGRGLLP